MKTMISKAGETFQCVRSCLDNIRVFCVLFMYGSLSIADERRKVVVLISHKDPFDQIRRNKIKLLFTNTYFFA